MSQNQKKWQSPVKSIQTFAAQEFVAACTTQWAAICDERGIVFFDVNGDGVFNVEDPVENLSFDKYYHGYCLKTHVFESAERPTYNAFILGRSYADRLNEICEDKGHNYSIKPEYAHEPYIVPALVKKPGEVFSNNWLVTCNLDNLKNIS